MIYFFPLKVFHYIDKEILHFYINIILHNEYKLKEITMIETIRCKKSLILFFWIKSYSKNVNYLKIYKVMN